MCDTRSAWGQRPIDMALPLQYNGVRFPKELLRIIPERKKRAKGIRTKSTILIPLLLAALLWGSAPVLAQEYIRDEQPVPESVDQVVTPMELAFQEKPKIPRFFPWLKEQLKDTPAFFRDTKLDLNARSYYFYRDNYPGSSPQINEAWAMGGALSYQSGWLLDHFAVGGVLYTSQPLYAPDEHDGTLLLKPGQEGYTQVGLIYGRVKLIENNFINIYRYEYNTPFMNKNDSRMTPNTFEGYTFTGAYGGKDGAPGFNYGFGYIDKIKPRNSDRFISMSEAAGADVKRGVFVGGGKVSYSGLTFGAINYYSDDIINIFYTEANYKFRVTERLGILVSAQFTDQRSVGEDLLKGKSFKANQFGVKADMSYGGGILSLGYTTDAKGDDLQSPWSGYPGYTSVQVKDFNRAGENAFIVKLSYDFTRLGLKGVSAYTLFTHGWDRVNPSTRESVANEDEFDADVQWRPEWKYLKGLWFRVRYANVHQYEGSKNTLNDFRLIVNYDFPLL
jgi:hypothetical protein